MNSQALRSSLPLLYSTPDAWAMTAMSDTIVLLNDHAHLERKAAANAMELLTRWPETDPPEHWTTAMTAIARDETEHLAAVTRLLYRRGGRMTRHHRNSYAHDLRKLVRLGGPGELIDRLLVSALIEARSCERFEILSRMCGDAPLARLYRGLWHSEHGHYRVFLDLARQVRPASEVDSRWQALLQAEEKIISAQLPGPRMHSGMP
jgi:tRNA 2-(methylsulfanyl)-N6-isopentenyladenosine37 hydroxylase